MTQRSQWIKPGEVIDNSWVPVVAYGAEAFL